jgi:hypothetical protein
LPGGALEELPGQWRHIIKGPEFTNGAPEAVGSGVSFGLAREISIDNDFIGRPVNLASGYPGSAHPVAFISPKMFPVSKSFR